MVLSYVKGLNKEYPFAVALSDNTPSVVLSDQLKSLDWRMRHAGYMGKVTPDELETVRTTILLLIGIE
jgi:mRNA interferase MazF